MPLPPTRERPATLIPHAGGDALAHPQKRRRGWLRALLLIVIVAAATGLGAFVAATLYVQKGIVDLVTPKTAETRAAQRRLEAPLPGEAATMLIIGSDHRSGADADDRRSDTIMLVRLDPKTKSISMLSFPRDLYVEIPGHGQSKINDAYSLGGPELVVQTVKALTGLDVHFIATVDFKGFREIVNRLGGVYVSVDREYFNENHGGSTNFAEIDLDPGYRWLSGKQALAFARYRHTDSDFYRMVRQQMFVAAFKKQVSRTSKISLAKEAGGLFKVMQDNTDMAAGGKNGKIDVRQTIDYIRLALSMRGSSIYQVHVDGGLDQTAAGASIVVADPTKIEGAVNAFLNPDERAQQKSVDQVTGQRSPDDDAGQLIVPTNVRVTILNGNGEDGSANDAADVVENLGYQIRIGGNAPSFDYANTRVQYRAPADRAIAESIAESFDDATVEQVPPGSTIKGRIFVIVGKGFALKNSTDSPGGVTVPTTETVDSNRVPDRTAPRVIADALYGLDEFNQMRGTTRVPLMYPTVRETSSTYEFPAATYTVHRYDAYRLVAKTGSGDYWGLQATAWPNPPLLDDPTRSVKKGARSYDLYFIGTRLHMVAWHQNGATYWVENTLLDKLSNETMLAIAEGVKPVPRSAPAR